MLGDGAVVGLWLITPALGVFLFLKKGGAALSERLRKKLTRLKQFEMSELVMHMITCALDDETLSEQALEEVLKEVRSHKVFKVPREKLDWFPVIDPLRCTSCRICFDFCPKGVYQVVADDVIVTSPYQCVFLCSKCSEKCPNQAIQFPDKADYRKYVAYR